MTNQVIRALLVQEGPANSDLKLAALLKEIGVDFRVSDDFSDITADFQKPSLSIVLLDLTDVDVADQPARIRSLCHQTSETPILLITDIEDPAFAHMAVRNGVQDILPAALLSVTSLKRTILMSLERGRQQQHRMLHSREDPLTGLGNRLLIEERFDRAIARADRQATLVGLVSFELDRVDWLIEQHGRLIVDRLLPMVGDRLMSEIRETDTVARTRDTGFTWLVEGLAVINDISLLVDRLPRVLAEPFSIEGRDVAVTVSVGVAVSPFHGRQFQAVNIMAEAAMLDVATLNGDGLLMLPLPSVAERPLSNINA
ncbi:MAG: diguanylate cyclase domain-containing protein [Geminicoccaceae bacterium]